MVNVPIWRRMFWSETLKFYSQQSIVCKQKWTWWGQSAGDSGRIFIGIQFSIKASDNDFEKIKNKMICIFWIIAAWISGKVMVASAAILSNIEFILIWHYVELDSFHARHWWNYPKAFLNIYSHLNIKHQTLNI